MKNPRGCVFVQFSLTTVSIEWGDEASRHLVSVITESLFCVQPVLVNNILRIHRDTVSNDFVIFRNNSFVLRNNDAAIALYSIIKQMMDIIISSESSRALIHSGLVSKRQYGVLLAGDSGSGKTTLTSLLCLKGWKYHSDELVSIADDNTSWEGFSRPLCLKKGWNTILQKLVSTPYYTIPKNEITIMPSASVFRDVGDSCRYTKPGVIIFVDYKPGCHAQLELVKKAASALRLSSMLMNSASIDRNIVSTVSGIARTVPSYLLTYSSSSDIDNIDMLFNQLFACP